MLIIPFIIIFRIFIVLLLFLFGKLKFLSNSSLLAFLAIKREAEKIVIYKQCPPDFTDHIAKYIIVLASFKLFHCYLMIYVRANKEKHNSSKTKPKIGKCFI